MKIKKEGTVSLHKKKRNGKSVGRVDVINAKNK